MRNLEQAKAVMEQWLAYEQLEDSLRKELALIEAEEDILDRFYTDLEFGTAGLRGIMGAGTNRMNIYTVGRATRGFAKHLKEEIPCADGESLSVAIAYDTRHHSELFAKEAAKILTAEGIKVWLFSEPTPTPVLSFAVRHHRCSGGIVITASHNPAQYNGYKVYDGKGCQITEEATEKILEKIRKEPLFTGPAHASAIFTVPESTKTAYLKAVTERRVGVNCGNLKVVYTPLNGTGAAWVKEILRRVGLSEVHLVPQQEEPDGRFPTCPYPNPEKPEAMGAGLDLCREIGNVDLLVATDPDSDRLGAAVWSGKEYKLLTGNEMGLLLLDFLCRTKPFPQEMVAVKTIVSTPLAEAVAAKYGIKLINVLTGFKYIGEQISLLEEKGEADRFLFGFEESCGFLSGSYVRDKDGILAAMLFCEMAAWYKKQKKTLIDALQDLYEEHGFYKSEVLEYSFPGAQGMEEMARILADLRKTPPKELEGAAVKKTIDYQDQLELPPANVLEYHLENGGRIMIRPSGTEPKLKVYINKAEA